LRGIWDSDFDPLDCAMGAAWAGPKPDLLKPFPTIPGGSNGDTVERIELLAAQLVGTRLRCPARLGSHYCRAGRDRRR
jgi:cobaltochelatase CobN